MNSELMIDSRGLRSRKVSANVGYESADYIIGAVYDLSSNSMIRCGRKIGKNEPNSSVN